MVDHIIEVVENQSENTSQFVRGSTPLRGEEPLRIFSLSKEKSSAADMKNSDTKWGMVWWVKVSWIFLVVVLWIFLPIIYIGFSEASNFQPKKPFLNVKIRNMKRLCTLLLAGF
jgi:hypothetical protein